MTKIILYIKKYWIILMIVSIAVLFTANFILKKYFGKGVEPTPPSAITIASIEGLTPGLATEDDLRKVFGTPDKTLVSEGKSVDQFKATTGLRTHEAVLQNGKLTFFKEVVTTKDQKTATDIKNIYGKPTMVLFDPNPNATFNLYVYPASGIAYLGHEDGGLLEIWYFQPTDAESFIKNWGNGYQRVPPHDPAQ